jgi:hypothetical protein
VIQHYILSREIPKSGYSSNVITIKNVCISYKIFSAMEGLSSVQTSQHPYLREVQPLSIQKGSPLASVFPQHNFYCKYCLIHAISVHYLHTERKKLSINLTEEIQILLFV